MTARAMGLVAILAVLWPIAAAAQDINEAVTVEDLGFTQRLNVGGRAAGLAGAYTATGDDVSSLVYNPAGLARIRRIEFGMGFQHERNTLENTFYGSPASVDLTSTTLDFMAGAYPLPTYRGSFVVGAGVFRVMSSDIDILNRGFNATTATQDDYRLQQSGSVYSYTLGAGVDLAPTLSVGASLYLLDGTIKALTQFSYENPPPLSPGDFRSESLVDDAKVNLDGYGATLGVQYYPTDLVTAGLAVTTPTPIELSGSAAQEDILYFVNAPDSLEDLNFSIKTKYQIPFRIDAGVSFTPPNFLVAFDIGYSDWTQAKVEDLQLKDSNLQAIFREVVDVRAGVEFTIPDSPFRVRAGYAYLPYPLRYLQADRIEGTEITKATVNTEHQLFTGGFGFLVGSVLTIDAAYEHHVGERSIPTLKDRRTGDRVLLSASYRL
jgi:long-subunit fatty acid transport protein